MQTLKDQIIVRSTKKKPNAISNKKIVFRLGELFCGPGGLALGALRSRVKKDTTNYTVEHAWASDYDKDSCDTYTHNITPRKPETVICQDVRLLDLKSLPAIDAFAYGFPCNDFSIVGETKGFNGKYGPLYTFGLKVIDYFKPKFFVAENVGGITSANDGNSFKKILHDLEISGNGYNLTTHLYKFQEYGIPQTRHRIIIVGLESKLGLKFKVPKPTTVTNPITSREALELPPIPQNSKNQELTVQSKKVIERLKHIKPNENAWNSNLPEHLKLNVKGAKLSQIYRRLHPDKPSYTVTGSGGGGTHGYHWEDPRALTNRERARIQTFPDSFSFFGKKESVRKQIGMAVSPKMSQLIFTAILKTIAGVEYPSVNCSWNGQRNLFKN